jgi:hypothetical protein
MVFVQGAPSRSASLSKRLAGAAGALLRYPQQPTLEALQGAGSLSRGLTGLGSGCGGWVSLGSTGAGAQVHRSWLTEVQLALPAQGGHS